MQPIPAHPPTATAAGGDADSGAATEVASGAVFAGMGIGVDAVPPGAAGAGWPVGAGVPIMPSIIFAISPIASGIGGAEGDGEAADGAPLAE